MVLLLFNTIILMCEKMKKIKYNNIEGML